MSEQKDIDQRLKLVEEALNDFWFEQDERMIVRHRRLAEKIERKLNELEKRIYDLEPLTTRFPELSKPTPEALPICPHCSKPINRRRVASDVCMCAWKGVPGKPEATPCEHRQDTGTGLKVCNRPPIQVPAPQPEQTLEDKLYSFLQNKLEGFELECGRNHNNDYMRQKRHRISVDACSLIRQSDKGLEAPPNNPETEEGR